MIPKQLFFIWLGDNKPNYVDFAVKAFKDVNPDFKVDLMEYNINQIEEQKVDNELLGAIKFCIKDNRKDLKFIQAVSNVYRYNLLRKYGGIYLDCDTFPVKPFDDKLLKENFEVTRSYNNDEMIYRDIFFIGKNKDFHFSDKTELIYPHNTPKKVNQNYEDYLILREKFFNCTLKYGEYFGDRKCIYINHYNDYTWNPEKCRTPLCKYDK